MNEPHPRTEADLIALIRTSDVTAPDALHERIGALVAERSSASERRSGLAGVFGAAGAPLGRLGAVGALLAVAVAVLAIVLGGGGGSLSVQETAALTLGRATAPAPAESPRHSAELVAAIEGVHFPYWEEHFGWRSTGQRTDRVGGRTVTTVFYANRSGQRIGYAIVSGTPPRVSGGVVWRRDGHPYRVLAGQRAEVVAWLRGGHLCVLSGRGVNGATLLRLASWGKHGSAA